MLCYNDVMKILKLSMKSGIILGYSIVILSAAAVGLFGYKGIRDINHQNKISARANRILVDAQDAQAGALRYIIYGDKSYQDEMEKEMGHIFTLSEELKELIRDENGLFHVAELDVAVHAYRNNNIDYYSTDLKKLDDGKIRIEKAQLIIREIIDVIAAAKEFSLTTERRLGGVSYLDKSSVERTWLVQEARNGINRFRILAQKYQLAVRAEEQDGIAEQWIDEIFSARILLREAGGVMESSVTRKEIRTALIALDEYEVQVNLFRESNRTLRGIQADQRENAGAVMMKARDVRDYAHDKILEATDAAVFEMILVLTLTLLAALLIVIITLRGVFRNLGCDPLEIQEITRKISEGNLTLDFEKKNMTGAYASMKEMSGKLTSIIGQIKQRTLGLEDVGTELSTSAEESSAALSMISENLGAMGDRIREQKGSVDEATSAISGVTENIVSLNRSIEDQASQVVESSSAIEEMVSSIESVSENMEKVTRSTGELNEASLNGLEKITRSNELINDVAEESRKLMETNQLINNIASQTNLLAMNAAIEAAHAGEAGRGFSVVADEIRKLAESTTMQSHEVKDMLNSIQRLIEEIVASSENTTESFGLIQDKVKLVRDRSDEISFALAEQSSGGKQVLEALTSMTRITETVRTGAGDINRSSAKILDEMMSLKKISEDSTMRIDELVQGANEIRQAVESVTSTSIANKEMVNGITGAMSFFATEGRKE